jgi:hypothetical protein
LAVVFAWITVSGCGEDATGPSDVTFDVIVEPSTAWLTPGDTATLTAEVVRVVPAALGNPGDSVPVDSAVAWSSSNTSVAQVSSTGRVTAVSVGTATITASAAGAAGTADVAVTEPGYPDVRGLWSGQYSVTSCELAGATDPFFCDFLFSVGSSLILDLDLDQLASQVMGVITQGSVPGEVEGTIDSAGVMTLSGFIGGEAFGANVLIPTWETALVGDTLTGSWVFEIEDLSGNGFGTATVAADVNLYSLDVLQFFGCAAEAEITIDGQIADSLTADDCQLDDGSLFDVYVLNGAAGDSLEVLLSSSSFDAFLLISDVDENVLGDDDDSGGGTNAAITVAFDVDATALVIANSFEPSESGPYTLSTTQVGGAAPAGVPQLTITAAGHTLAWTSVAKSARAGRERSDLTRRFTRPAGRVIKK